MRQGERIPEVVDHYLSVATCLLMPSAARRVRAELHGNLHQDMLDALCCGLNEEAAWWQALQNAGPAWRTALELGRVHTLGLLLRILLLGGALGGAAFAVQSGSLDIQHVQVGQP